MIAISMVVMVFLPIAIASWYLWARAADQYASRVGFAIRSEEASSPLDSIFGAIGSGGTSSASDAEVLYQFMQSQSLVRKLDEELDLRGIWAKANPKIDPYFSYHPPGTIEDLLKHWKRMVRIFYDSSTGLIELRVHAFDPDDALAITEAIYAESTQMINAMTAVARADAIGYARDELNSAVEKLKVAREAVTQFRNRTQIVDPTMDLQGQAGLLSTLNFQLAEALIEFDLLVETTREGDPRIVQVERKVKVIEARIADEKRKLGLGDPTENSEALATLVGEFERLTVDREFAEQTYTAALASFDSAQAEARRQTRYLAAYLTPTRAERAEFPERLTILGLIALFAFLIWALVCLIAYSLRDRR